MVYFDRFGPRTVKALSGKVGQQKTKSVGVLSLLKQRHLLLSLAIAGIVAPLALSAPAQAASDGSASDKSGSPASGIAQDIISYFGFGPDQANNPTDPQAVIERPRVELTPREITPVLADMETRPPQLPVVTAVSAPSVETPLHRLFCVEYARMRSGLAVFGDAKTWWARAKNLYTRVSHPVEEAVMVFSGSKRLKRGHVAVVTEIVSPREIIVDQANWQNRGEIDHATPVLDVSKHNDWSQVRVWDIPSGSFGSRVYRISGFIAKGLETASRE